MKAVVLTGLREAHVGDFPEPFLDSNSVKIAVSYCGLCGTDLHKFEGKSGTRKLTYPVPLGHEISGTVVEVGANVTKFSVGDRVTADPNWSCGNCYYCHHNLPHMCKNGRGVVKGMADYICPPQENVYKLPDSLDMRDAALTEPLSCCLHGMDLLNVKLGETVVVVGMGAIGAIMVELCHMASGAEVIVIETDETKRELAFELGATQFINPSEQKPAEAIVAAGVVNVEKVIECVGLPVTINSALDVAGKGARVVLFGLGDPEKPVSFNQYAAITKELDIQTAFLNPHTMDRAVRLLASGTLHTDKLISKVMSAEELIDELSERTYSRHGKVVVKWD